jgi:hypothetical protein
MTAEAYHNYDDLHRLVDQLKPDQADTVRAVVLRLVTGEREPDERDDQPGEWPPPWFGSVTSDDPNIAERTREILHAEYGPFVIVVDTGPLVAAAMSSRNQLSGPFEGCRS